MQCVIMIKFRLNLTTMRLLNDLIKYNCYLIEPESLKIHNTKPRDSTIRTALAITPKILMGANRLIRATNVT